MAFRKRRNRNYHRKEFVMERSVAYYQELVRSLAALHTEVEWAEFKVNNKDPERIAKYISAMSNEATLCDRAYGYIAWGIKDDTHEIVGTEFEYRKIKKGNMELELWLNRQINPKIEFKFHEIPFENANGEPIHVTLIEIPCAEGEPTKYERVGYARVGSNLQPLAEYPEKEAELWRKFDKTLYEKRIAYSEATDDDVVTLLDYPGYYRKIGAKIPANRDKVLRDLIDEKFINQNDGGNAGAPLVAIERIVDTVPLSRNENMAGFMHRCGICEERGSGFDKVIAATRAESLIAPKVENQNNQFTKVTLYSKVDFDMTTKEDRVRTCYMIACLAFVTSDAVTNSDIRNAFGLDEKEKVKASRIIRDTLEAKLIKPVDPSTAPRYMKYVPYWA